MSLTLNIPDEVMDALPVPATERERYLRLEMASSLYAREVLSLGKAAAMAGMSKFDFGVEVGRRGIPRTTPRRTSTPIWRMLVVSDTSPLSNLAVIGRLELLRQQFGPVSAPPAVCRERPPPTGLSGEQMKRCITP